MCILINTKLVRELNRKEREEEGEANTETLNQPIPDD